MNLDLSIREDHLNTLRKKWKNDSSSCQKDIQNNDITQLPTRKSKIIDLLSALKNSRSGDKKNFLREIIYKIILDNGIYEDPTNLRFLRNNKDIDLVLKGLDYEDIVSEREQERLLTTGRIPLKQDLLFAIELASRADINRFTFDQVIDLLKYDDELVTSFARHLLMEFPKEKLNGNKLLKIYQDYCKNFSNAIRAYNNRDTRSLVALSNAQHIDLQLVLEDLLIDKFPNHIPHKILLNFVKDSDSYISSQAIEVRKRDLA
jgi:hypothetical protein